MQTFAWMVAKVSDPSGLPGLFPTGFFLAHSH